ncbi:MAG TPA: hypothetical protein PKK94_28940, partial [Leptospiraceae bacterium]|nr:hypothetical protein [Leptospiraceae bacterium]
MSKKGSIEIIRNSELDDYLKSGLGNISPEHKNGKDPKIQEGLPGTALGSINLDTAIIELLLKWKKIHKGNNPKTPDYLIIVNRECESNVRDKF